MTSYNRRAWRAYKKTRVLAGFFVFYRIVLDLALVEPRRIELPTFALRTRRSPS